MSSIIVKSSCWSWVRRSCAGPGAFSVRLEAEAGPIGGYYNSCSFAHWSGISSPQGQGAVSGILIGKSCRIFTSLHILLHLLANEERSCHVWQSKNKNSRNRNPISVVVVLFIFFHTENVVNTQNKPHRARINHNDFQLNATTSCVKLQVKVCCSFPANVYNDIL